MKVVTRIKNNPARENNQHLVTPPLGNQWWQNVGCHLRLRVHVTLLLIFLFKCFNKQLTIQSFESNIKLVTPKKKYRKIFKSIILYHSHPLYFCFGSKWDCTMFVRQWTVVTDGLNKQSKLKWKKIFIDFFLSVSCLWKKTKDVAVLALHHQKDVLHETISLMYTVKLRIPFVF